MFVAKLGALVPDDLNTHLIRGQITSTFDLIHLVQLYLKHLNTHHICS
jgi:hypothetical protein